MSLRYCKIQQADFLNIYQIYFTTNIPMFLLEILKRHNLDISQILNIFWIIVYKKAVSSSKNPVADVYRLLSNSKVFFRAQF